MTGLKKDPKAFIVQNKTITTGICVTFIESVRFTVVNSNQSIRLCYLV